MVETRGPVCSSSLLLQCEYWSLHVRSSLWAWWSLICDSKCYSDLLGCARFENSKMSWHNSPSSDGFIISFIIYGRDCVQAASVMRAGLLRWGEFIYQEMSRLTPLAYYFCYRTLCRGCVPFVGLFVATRQHFSAGPKNKRLPSAYFTDIWMKFWVIEMISSCCLFALSQLIAVGKKRNDTPVQAERLYSIHLRTGKSAKMMLIRWASEKKWDLHSYVCLCKSMQTQRSAHLSFMPT